MFFSPEFKEEVLEAARETYFQTKERQKKENNTMRVIENDFFHRQKIAYSGAINNLHHSIQNNNFGLKEYLQDIYNIAARNINPLIESSNSDKTIGTINKQSKAIERVTEMLLTVNTIMENLVNGKDNTAEIAKANALAIEFNAIEKTLNLRKLGVALMVFTAVVITAGLIIASIFAPVLFPIIAIASALISIPTVYAIPVFVRMSKSYGYGSLAKKVGLFTASLSEFEEDVAQQEIEDALVQSDEEDNNHRLINM